MQEVERLDNDTRTLSRRAVHAMSDTTLTALVDRIGLWTGRLVALQASLVREIDGRGLVKAAGSVNASTWLRDRAHLSIHDAHQVTGVAAVLDARPRLAAAVLDGAMTPEQALITGRVLDDLPADLDPRQRITAEEMMLDYATQFEPRMLKQLGARILAHVAPELHDEILRKRLEDDERRANRDRYLNLRPDGEGRTRLSGVLDTVSAATLTAALSPLMSPLPNGPAGAERRTPAMRRADALVEVCRLALRTGELPADGGQPPQVNVTIDYAALAAAVRAGVDYTAMAGAARDRHPAPTGEPVRAGARAAATVSGGTVRAGARTAAGGAGGTVRAGAADTAAIPGPVRAGILDTGEPLSATTVRRMACDARILPVVLDGAGIPIDIGRARRLYTGAARAAVLLRDGGCAFPGCDRPPKWCDIHHVVSWVDGGPTDRDNGVALCGFHHRLIHHRAWTVRLGPDRRPTFTPPADIDPEQGPRRNPYHQRT